jgi:hypothetical protein
VADHVTGKRVSVISRMYAVNGCTRVGHTMRVGCIYVGLITCNSKENSSRLIVLLSLYSATYVSPPTEVIVLFWNELFPPCWHMFVSCVNSRHRLAIIYKYVKVKSSRCRPGVAQRVPGSRLPDFHDIRHMKVVRSSASRTGRLYPQEMFLVLIFTRGW